MEIKTIKDIVEGAAKRADQGWESSWTDSDSEWLTQEITQLLTSIREEINASKVQMRTYMSGEQVEWNEAKDHDIAIINNLIEN